MEQMTLDLVFQRRSETRKQLRDLKTMLKDAFLNSKKYQETIKSIEQLKITKEQLENEIRQDYAKEVQKIGQLKLSIDNDTQLLSDLAVTQMMKGETVGLKDEFEREYEPKFKVSFSKKK